MVAEQLRQVDIKASALILEPEGRNTAPAVALAALRALATDAEALLLVLPADHIIQDVAAFADAVSKALPLAQEGRLVTFGVVPSSAETGYGYIKCGASLAPDLYDLERFVEKPDAATAQAYLESGSYLWNSGMFLLRAATYLEQLQEHAPEILACCRRAMEGAAADLDFVRPGAEAFAECPSDSIDYAVMEKTTAGAVAALDCGWSDVGAWSALWEVAQRDEQGNVCKGDVILDRPLTILWIAVPLFLQTVLIFALTYGLARLLRLPYRDAAPSALIGASNHFEVAIATAVMLFGLSSGAALATVVGVLIEVPVMLLLVRICTSTASSFPDEAGAH